MTPMQLSLGLLLTSVLLVAAQPLPRWNEALITDKGDAGRARGWYDAQCLGVQNDYCRFVGDAPSTFWSCALAGSPDQYSPRGRFNFTTTSRLPCQGSSNTTWPLPRMPDAMVTDRGLTDLPSGWFDMQCQGAINDWCRFVGPPDSPYWSCALAGGTSQYTSRGQFSYGASSATPCGTMVLPRRPEAAIQDKGWPDMPSGWMDAQRQGANNDFCRWVGERSAMYWSCALAGSNPEVWQEQFTPPGQFSFNTTSPSAVARPEAWPNPNITDRGIAGMESGWFDLSCLSGPSDFCRYQDFRKLPLPGGDVQWTCALAGDNRQYTEIGYITRDISSIKPCSQRRWRRRQVREADTDDAFVNGWYDAQRQGWVADYCYTTRDVICCPNQGLKFQCLLAGQTGPATPSMFHPRSTPRLASGPRIMPRRSDYAIDDWGLNNMTKGWYDTQCQGMVGDYCRYVARNNQIYWSCALAGSNNSVAEEQYTEPGQYIEEVTTRATSCRGFRVQPRRPRTAITDIGWDDMPSGYFDAQCQGAANDFCRWVGERNAMYWSCALAGSNPEVWQEQFTPPGQFSFNLTSKLPCTARKLPRRLLSANSDTGHPALPSGWYDASCQGAANDYCRFVPKDRPANETSFSCALAGSDQDTTPPGQYNLSTTSQQPCVRLQPMADSLITDKGLVDRPRGWFDAQCQGWPNDYCRWVSINGTSAFWSCALAGGNNQYSPANMFSESTTYSVPCAPGFPRPLDTWMTDMGNPNKPRGFRDAQCSGAANDYCRYVGSEPQWWSCALANITSWSQYTNAGRFTEGGTSTVPCSAAGGNSG